MTRTRPQIASTLTIAGMLLALSPLGAWAAPMTIKVTGGDPAATQIPVRVAISLPQGALGGAMQFDTVNGLNILGQITEPSLLSKPAKAPEGMVAKELVFILPKAPGAEGLTLTWETDSRTVVASGEGNFVWHKLPADNPKLFFGSRPVLQYMGAAFDDSTPEKRDETYKVYHQLYSPDGSTLLTKGAGSQFPHHRGLFYGFNKINYGEKKADTWHCKGAHLSNQDVISQEAGPVLGRHLVAVGWRGPDKEIFALEHREMTVYKIDPGWLVEFASRLESKVGPVSLDGDPQHAGFQFRAHAEVAEKTNKQTYYLRPDGAGKPGETRNWPGNKDFVNLPWNAMSFVIDGKRYTAQYMDRPENPKEARFSERDYGRFGSYFEYKLDTEKPLELNYRLWAQAGETTVDEAAARAKAFTAPPTAKVQ